MSFQSLSKEVQEIAERELTRKQLDVFKLYMAKASNRQMAEMLDISERVVRDTRKRAVQIMGIHMRAAGLLPDKEIPS